MNQRYLNEVNDMLKLETLAFDLPEDVLKRKWAGDFDGEIALIDALLTKELPEMLKERLRVELSDGEWYVTSNHEMSREHSLSFIAFLSNDTLILKKLYPEWSPEARFPFFAHGTLFWYCTRHGLAAQQV